MSETPRDAIRRLLKTFGIQADEDITAHLENSLDVAEIQIRLTLTDLTDYGDSRPDEELSTTVEGSVPTP